MKWTANTKEILAWILAWLSFILGWTITWAGFHVEPKGEIHPTVIVIFGQSMVITGALIGCNLSFKSQGNALYERLAKLMHETIETKFREESSRANPGEKGVGG